MGNSFRSGRSCNIEGEIMERIGILGLGRVGRSILAYLLDKGAKEILLYDENPEAFLNRYVAGTLGEKNVVRLETPDSLARAGIIIKSPGISNELEWVKALDREGVPMVDEIEFVWKELGRPFTIAVTGTNGKSTTTAWISEILKAAGRKVFCGGNIAPGNPFSEALSLSIQEVYVIEISTFQLERCPEFRPDVGVITNITADHLNRHTNEDYVNLKLSLFKNAAQNDSAILNRDDNTTMNNIESIRSRKVLFSLRDDTADAYTKNGGLYIKETKVSEIKDIPLPGMHNVANALAAIAAASQAGVEPKQMQKGLKRFKGLPHRMEFLGELKGRKVYNNSMCTNPEAFYYSVTSFEESSVIIAGGTEKNLPLDPFIKGVKERAKYLILFGENSERIAEILCAESQFSSYIIVDSLRAALDAALKASLEGDIILFAPGFASFGNFKNFEERGHAFIQEFREYEKRI